MNARASIFAVCVLAIGLLGEECDPFGTPSGETEFQVISDLDSRCVAVDSAALAFAESDPDTLWVAASIDGVLVPFDVTETPPVLVSEALVSSSISGGLATLVPQIDGTMLHTVSQGIQFTGAGNEFVLRFVPTAPEFDLFALHANELFPDIFSGTTKLSISSTACIDVPTGTLDSRGDLIQDHGSGTCASRTGPGFTTNLTSVAAISSTDTPDMDRLFVTTRNLDDIGDGDPQYFPATVLVYDIDSSLDPVSVTPNSAILLEDRYQATGAVAYTSPVSGEHYVLILVSGAVAFCDPDDPAPGPNCADQVGFFSTHPASIVVLDADDPSLGVIRSYPLTDEAVANGLVVDPNNKVAVAGSLEGRKLFAMDLDALADDLAGTPSGAVLIAPKTFPGRSAGADPASCPGQVRGRAFNQAGDTLFAADFCDGVIAEIPVDTTGIGPIFPSNAERIIAAAVPIDSEDTTAVRGIFDIAVRPESTIAGGGDVFVLGVVVSTLGVTEGRVCGLNIE